MPFDADLFEQYGRVLLQTGDNLEAGKFLLLSGRRRSDYDAAIALFRHRYGHGAWQRVFSTFPRSARRCPWSKLPVAAREDLAGLGVPVCSDDEQLSFAAWRGRDEKIGTSGIVFIVLLLAIVGFVTSVLVVHFFYEGQ